MTKAIYPGSFDPMTNGHLDIIKRVSKVFNNVVVAVGDNPGKKPFFNKEERVQIITEVVKEISNIEVTSFDGLLVDFAKKKKAPVIIRGVRTVSDFEYEYQMALANKTLAPDIETFFMMTEGRYSYLSSTLIKEIARLGGDVGSMVPTIVASQIGKKYET